jgi:hypothetical protein
MWHWFNCYLSGRHDYGMWCEPGTIFLRCIHCGRRSPGWSLDTSEAHSSTKSKSSSDSAKRASSSARPAQILPFDRQTRVEI